MLHWFNIKSVIFAIWEPSDLKVWMYINNMVEISGKNMKQITYKAYCIVMLEKDRLKQL